jgi:hypothetical protein
MATVVASWAEYARGARGASVQRLPGVTAAVIPEGPERAVYNKRGSGAVGFRDLGRILEYGPPGFRPETVG